MTHSNNICQRTVFYINTVVRPSLAKSYYFIRSLFIYHNYDSTSYWKKRSLSCVGQSRVLWQNEEYNLLYRNIQKDILSNFIPITGGSSFHVLDVGCGIGIVSKMLIEINPDISVDAVDFPEMIRIARIENPSDHITYVESCAEDFLDSSRQYQLVLSSACYSAIRDIDKMKKAVVNGIQMLAPGGTIVMIDPLHKWSYLARVRFSSRDMVRFMKNHGFVLAHKGGVLFWPYRLFLCNTNYGGERLSKSFKQGEWLLGKLGRHLWADYKVLAFRKIC
jgi:2-polyprenyl-3-methyl-5-hydroxy-6-metoxy-1,4-benzoquinol methylase